MKFIEGEGHLVPCYRFLITREDTLNKTFTVVVPAIDVAQLVQDIMASRPAENANSN